MAKAKAKKSEFVKSFGKMFEIVKLFVNAVLGIGGDGSDLERLLKDADLRKRVAELIVGAKKAAGDVFTAMVDYNTAPAYADLKTRFDWVDKWHEMVKFEAIEACKSVSREPREVAFEVLHLYRSISTADALAELDRRGLRPALYEELLAFAKAHPDEQREYPIVALGSVFVDPDGCRRVACLIGDGVGRYLGLGRDEGDWGGSCRFLAVSKP